MIFINLNAAAESVVVSVGEVAGNSHIFINKVCNSTIVAGHVEAFGRPENCDTSASQKHEPIFLTNYIIEVRLWRL